MHHSENINPAPVCLFVYNRPEHTLKTLNSLKKCRLANKSRLYIFADGLKHGGSIDCILNIEKVRNIIKSEKWCESVEIIESERNKGLAKSIIEGVTYVINRYEKVIVLEDDLELSEGFLEYMNNALNYYENNEKVMHIAGFTPPLNFKLPETYFFHVPTCWGWASWKRAWDHFNPSATQLLPLVKQKGLQKFDIMHSVNYYRMLKKNSKGYVNSWFIRWYASIYLLDGLCLHPGKSLVNNTGIDRSGVNSYRSNVFDQTTTQQVCISEIKYEIRKDVLRAYFRFNFKVKMVHLPEYIWRLLTNRIKT